MKKTGIFALITASLMVLIAISSIPVSANGADGVIYGTIFGVVKNENDWGEDSETVLPLGNVKVTIIRSDGDSRTVYTDSRGYFSHTVNFKDYDEYIIETGTIKDVPVDGELYTFKGTSEDARITWWNKFVNGKKVNVHMDGDIQEDKVKSKTITSYSNINAILALNNLRGAIEALLIR